MYSRLCWQMNTKTLVVAAILAVSAWANAQAETYENVRSLYVADGDTVKMAFSDGREAWVRLSEIDAPEKGQPYGLESKAALASLLNARAVTLQVQGTDQYGRVLATLYVDGRTINDELVREGAAWVYGRYAKRPILYSIQDEAKKGRYGLWSDPAPIEPWIWRRNHK